MRNVASHIEAGIYTGPETDSSLPHDAVGQTPQKSIFLHKLKEMHLTHTTVFPVITV